MCSAVVLLGSFPAEVLAYEFQEMRCVAGLAMELVTIMLTIH